MAQKLYFMKANKLHSIYGWLLTVLLIAVGIALIASCLSIYYSGARPYSPISIAEQFQKISLLVYITLAAILGGFVLSLALPVEEARAKANPSPWMQLCRLKKKAGCLTDDFAASAAKERTQRRIFILIAVVLIINGMRNSLVYMLDISHFTVENLNTDVIKALIVCFVPAVLGLLLCLLCKYLNDKSIKREAAIWKEAIAAGAYIEQTLPGKKTIGVTVARALIFTAAFALIIAGVFNGSAEDVLLKAIAICTECIGLG